MTLPPFFPLPKSSYCSSPSPLPMSDNDDESCITDLKPRLSKEDEEGVQLLLGISSIVSKEMLEDENSDPYDCNSEFTHDSTAQSPSPTLEWKGFRTVSMDENEKQLDKPSNGRSFLPVFTSSYEEPMATAAAATTRSGCYNHVMRPRPVVVTPILHTKRQLIPFTPTLNRLEMSPLPSSSELSQLNTQSIAFPKLPPLLNMKLEKKKRRKYNISMETTPSATFTEKRAKPSITQKESTPDENKKKKKPNNKKFSWKNYPELEDFLIANRQSYLAHSSALNYTSEQKDYNNSLTSRLLEYAANCGYGNLIEEKQDEFGGSFTSVRDRIRCYYKSYLQSYRRRLQRRARAQQRLALSTK